eukprot:CAMPEP_0170509514 /NCGR_PEP_ID=MMETSP0208-20121228/65255_1 /TAXON_ID=197538 /ORGANISM="Strombidium inclinatum, Strain S3" /LENGTH=71 /DNA_ID=CAMNT_0010792879 /DNA_START=788 /DNA_END=1003 /DNA_ORIENTATION=-
MAPAPRLLSYNEQKKAEVFNMKVKEIDTKLKEANNLYQFSKEGDTANLQKAAHIFNEQIDRMLKLAEFIKD